jgi:hypothetical protein
MHSRSWELQTRTARFATAVAQLCAQVTVTVNSQKIVRRLTTASRAMLTGYQVASASSSPDKFIAAISAVASNAKKARGALVLLLEMGHVSIEAVREVILEARGLEAIFTVSRNTAKRRARKRMVSRRNPSERAANASDGKTPRKRRNPPGVT